ncbi:MAG: histone deacetylase [Desulfovibrionaceae bacterium]
MRKAEHRLGVIFFPAFDWAISPTHPEREERLLYTQDQLHEEGLFDVEGIREYKPEIAHREDVERTHFCFPDVDAVTTRSHLVSAGGAIRAARLVMEKEREKAFALVRPPGHHAMKCVRGARGFCNVNMEAIMVEWLREHYGVRRIAIVDTDCHHGDGTQDIFWHDPDVLFISMHQDGRTLFPGTGFPIDSGGPNARGRTINIPLPPETGDEGLLLVMQEVVMPLLEAFKPELVINSAGQDNHYTDPITNMNVSAQGYARLNSLLNPDIAVLEGGYAIQGALPYVNLGICLAMAGMDYSTVREPDYRPEKLRQPEQITKYIEELCRQMPRVYFDPPAAQENLTNGLRQGDWHVRNKSIYYDTDNFQETQKESIHLCGNCRGLLKIESQVGSTRCLGVEIPLDACPACQNLGHAVTEQAQIKGAFRYVQLIDRVNKEYSRFGF